MGSVGIVVGRLGLVPVLVSFEVIVAMEDCASANFLFACPSCSVRSVIVFDMFATVCPDVPESAAARLSAL